MVFLGTYVASNWLPSRVVLFVLSPVALLLKPLGGKVPGGIGIAAYLLYFGAIGYFVGRVLRSRTGKTRWIFFGGLCLLVGLIHGYAYHRFFEHILFR